MKNSRDNDSRHHCENHNFDAFKHDYQIAKKLHLDYDANCHDERHDDEHDDHCNCYPHTQCR